MDAMDVNGGNAITDEAAREIHNLENNEKFIKSETPAKKIKSEIKEQEDADYRNANDVNGDYEFEELQKEILLTSTSPKKKTRKIKVEDTDAAEESKLLEVSAQQLNSNFSCKRKLSESEGFEKELDEPFHGFDSNESKESVVHNDFWQKLIAEPEQNSPMKKRKLSMSNKNSKTNDHTFEEEDNATDSEDKKMIIDNDQSNSALDASSLKSEKSAISSISVQSNKSRKSRGGGSRGASPGNPGKKIQNDMNNPMYREPFKLGWKRELVYRATNSDNAVKKQADIYYYTPEGKKTRSFREVAEQLRSSSVLTVENFTFFKEPIGLNDPDKEIIRDAKKGKDAYIRTPKVVKAPVVVTPPVAKKVPPPKKVAEKVVATPSPAKPSPKVTKTPSAAFKIKLQPRKSSSKKEIKSPQTSIVAQEPEVSSPPNFATTSKRNHQMTVVEKTPPIKTKKLAKEKIQDPCSIRCPTSMGIIPNLECKICVRLYHPECAGVGSPVYSSSFVCKNCQPEIVETLTNTTLIPPQLIPLNMLGSQKSQLISYSRPLSSTETQQEKGFKICTSPVSSGQSLVTDRTFQANENEFLQRPDQTAPKPAQNIAIMAGTKFIVVPKNNSMAVQPAITSRHDKIGDKPPNFLDDCETAVKTVKTKLIEQKEKLEEKSAEVVKQDEIEIGNLVEEAVMPVPMEAETHTQPAIEKTSNTISASNMTDISEETEKANSAQIENRCCTQSSEDVDDSHFSKHEQIGSKYTVNNSIQKLVRRKIATAENDHRQHFMSSVCAGYQALSRIFQYLKVQELLRAARVCKMWRDLAAHPTLWKTVRMKNSQVTDWEGLADTLKRCGTQHLDLRKMLIVGEADNVWQKFVTVIPRVNTLTKLEISRCTGIVVEEVIKNCPQLEVLSAATIKCDSLSLESVGNLSNCSELKLKAASGMSLDGDLSPLLQLSKLTQLSLTSVKELGKKKIEIIQNLVNLESLELGECSDFPDKFGTVVLLKLQKLERLRLEKGQGTCCTFDILEGISQLPNLNQLELVNFDVKSGFDNYLATCINIKRLLVIPTYISQSATSNNMILGGVTKLSNNLTHLIWGVTQELLRVTELFVDQCQANKNTAVDSIPVLKPVPCLNLIEDTMNNDKEKEEKQHSLSNPQIEVLPLPQLQKLLLTALPKTRVKILKIPFHATWRQSFNESTA